MKENNLYLKKYNELEEKVRLLELKDFSGIVPQNRNAVFDLDNTLLIGDIGDAVFSMLKVMKAPIDLSWKAYSRLLTSEGKEIAYSKVVSVMAGLSVELIEQATELVLLSKKKKIEVEGVSVPVPRAHPAMIRFVEYLREKKINIYVISATNIFSVKKTADFFFGIPQKNAFGIQPEIKKIYAADGSLTNILTENIKKPLTISTGKAELYWNNIGKIRPLITAGDSESDISLLNLVDSNGFSIWVGDDPVRYEKIRTKSSISNQFFFFKR